MKKTLRSVLCLLLVVMMCFGGFTAMAEDPCEHQNTKYDGRTIHATCISAGYMPAKICTDCGEVLVEGKHMPVDEGNHVFLIRVPASRGSIFSAAHPAYDYCPLCKFDSRDAVDMPCESHQWTEIRPGKEANCVEPGYTAYRKCDLCGLEEMSKPTALKDHNYQSLTEVTKEQVIARYNSAAYPEVGETIGDRYDAELAMLKIVYDRGPIAASESNCSAHGHTGDWYCTNCGHVELDIQLPKGEHNWVSNNDGTPAQCETDGLTDSYDCTICGDTKGSESIPAHGHTMKLVTRAKLPTLFRNGITAAYECEHCSYGYGGAAIPALLRR